MLNKKIHTPNTANTHKHHTHKHHINKQHYQALLKAVSLVGGINQLAKNLDIKQSRASTCVNRDKQASLKYVKDIEKATGGVVDRYQLRGDIYGLSPTQLDFT